MKIKAAIWLGTALLLSLFMVFCGKPKSKEALLKAYPLDDLAGIIQQTGVQPDQKVKKEGTAALRIDVSEAAVIPLFETGDIDIENAVLVYQAKVRTREAQGNVYLEMWCHFEGKGEFFSRGLHSPLKGTTDWTFQETNFFLKEGENPDNVKLNIVSEGTGTVWVDDIRLLKRAQTN